MEKPCKKQVNTTLRKKALPMSAASSPRTVRPIQRLPVTAILLDPLGAFVVGGVGAFLGDFFFYPAPMFVSLVTHGLQAVVVSLCAHRLMKDRRGRAALVGVILGVVINVVGYSIGRAFVYATPEAAMLKFPFQVFQAAFGAVVSMLLCFKAGLLSFWDKFSAR